MTSYIDGLIHHDAGVQKAIQEEVHRLELLEAKKKPLPSCNSIVAANKINITKAIIA